MTYGTMPVPKHHYEWYYSICIDDDHDFINIIGPRSSAKSVVIENSMAWFLGNKPHTTNMITSAAGDVAESRLKRVKEMMKSDRFRDVFPNVFVADVPDRVDRMVVWSDRYVDKNGNMYTGLSEDEWKYFMTMFHNNRDPSLYAAGILSHILGMRVSGMIILDDIHDKLNSATEGQRLKVRGVVQETIMGFLTPGAKMVNICNRWAEGDFGGFAKETLNDDGNPTWTTYELYAYNEDGTSYWPEVWPVKRLRDTEIKIGTPAFQATYMNNPLGFSQGLFKPEHLKKDIPDPLPDFDEIYISVDLSFTEGRGDFCVASAIGRWKEDVGPFKIGALAMIRGRWSLPEAFRQIFRFTDAVAETYGFVTKLLFEKQGSQIAIVKDKLAEAERLYERHYPYQLVPIIGNKDDRAAWLATKCQNGDFYISQEIIKQHPAIISELVGYGRAKNDDIVDSFDLPGQLPHWKLGETGFKSGVNTVSSPYML